MHCLQRKILITAGIAFLAAPASPAAEHVHLDAAGTIRWNADDREVALFGANYSLPSATGYRATGLVGADRRKLVEQDFAHFAHMGWDAVRLSFWGDWENSDKDGNLIANDHLDVMDYAIAEAKKRRIYILLTPIMIYAAWWPDGKATDKYPGFSAHAPRHLQHRRHPARFSADPHARLLLARYPSRPHLHRHHRTPTSFCAANSSFCHEVTSDDKT